MSLYTSIHGNRRDFNKVLQGYFFFYCLSPEKISISYIFWCLIALDIKSHIIMNNKIIGKQITRQ